MGQGGETTQPALARGRGMGGRIMTRKLGKESQISYRSTDEIVGNLDLAAARLATRTKFDGAKLRTGHLVNAVALWLARLPEEECVAFAVPLLRELETYLRGDEDLMPSGGRRKPGQDVKDGHKGE
jgi:hypothetical protein